MWKDIRYMHLLKYAKNAAVMEICSNHIFANTDGCVCVVVEMLCDRQTDRHVVMAISTVLCV